MKNRNNSTWTDHRSMNQKLIASICSCLSNKRGGGNKREQGAKFHELMKVRVGINEPRLLDRQEYQKLRQKENKFEYLMR